ncbi:MAG: MFS transporter [Bacillota bacterium]
MWGPFLALHASDYLQLSRYQINTYYAVGACATAAVSPLAGRAVERFGTHRTLGASCLALGASAIMWALQAGAAGIIAGYILVGISFQFAIISMDTFRVVALDEGIRARALGAAGTISMIASSLVIPLAGYLRETVGALAPFVMALACSCVILVSVAQLHGDDGTGVRGFFRRAGTRHSS